MKAIKYTIIAALLTFSISNKAVNDENVIKEELKRDIQVGLSERVIQDFAYINLKMLNESKPGVYTLVRREFDGTNTLIDSKEIAVNAINQPILYSFKVPALDNDNYEYTLYRISNEVEVVQVWCYCYQHKEFVKDNTIFM